VYSRGRYLHKADADRDERGQDATSLLQKQEDSVSQFVLLVVNLEPLSTSILPVRTRSGGLAVFSESLRQI
jgi:hypothetical protein